jgi:hypothetical protein
MTLQSFVIAGKAKVVFDCIAAKAAYQRHQEECERAVRQLNAAAIVTGMVACPFSKTATCNVPGEMPCSV